MNSILEDIIEVKTLERDGEINDHLNQGWVILQVFTTCYDPELFYAHQRAFMRLGRPSGVLEYTETLTEAQIAARERDDKFVKELLDRYDPSRPMRKETDNGPEFDADE